MEEDGQNKYCQGECASETPHRAYMHKGELKFACEFCEHVHKGEKKPESKKLD